MSSGQPWSLRGLDPKAREIAKDLAYQAGLSLGDWLHQIMREEGLVAPAYSPAPYASPAYPPPGYGSGYGPGPSQGHFGPTPRELADNAERVASRLSAVEDRAGLGEQSLTALADKIAQSQAQVRDSLAGFDLALRGLRADQARLQRQVQTLGADPSAARALTGLRALEGAMSKVVALMRRDQGQSQSALSQIRNELGRVNERVDQVESLAGQSQTAARTLAEKLEQAEADQIAARARLEQAISQLQDRIRLVQAEGQTEAAQASAAVAQRLGALSEDVQA